MNHNEEMGFDRSQGSDEERFFLCVPERGEDCTFTVKDICTADDVTYDGALNNTLFEVSAGDAALIHDGAIGHVFDSNYVSVATGSFSSSDGGFNVPGNWSSSTLIGFQYSVGGDRVFLSAGILFGNVRVQQVTGGRSMASNSGDSSMASNSGDSSMAEVLGENSIAIIWGVDCKAKASLGSWICLSEWVMEDKWILKNVKVAKIDGKKLKADTFYKLENGKFIEV